MISNPAPIVLFVYNRPDLTNKTLEALSQNYLANQSLLYIYSDGAKSVGDLPNVDKVRACIRLKKWCGQVEIIESIENKGLANSIIKGVSEVVERHGRVIVLEDDLVTSPFFLQYMNEALDIYENESKVLSIGAFNFFANGNNTPDTFFIPMPDCWGWATWKDKWQLFEPDGQKLLKQLRERNLIDAFNLYGQYPFEQMLVDQINGKNNSWAIRWQAVAYLNNTSTLYPKYSVTKNIGFESGTHGSGPDFNKFIKWPNHKIIVAKQPITTHDAIINQMTSRYKEIFKAKRSYRSHFKKLLKYILPPFVVDFMRSWRSSDQLPQNDNIWDGDFISWGAALAASSGYNADNILAQVKNSTIRVKNGEAVYERDAVLFDQLQYAWPMLSILQKIAAEYDNKLDLIDFGGSLGTTYFQNRQWLANIHICWHVIEQQNFVTTGINYLQNEELTFHYTIDEVLSISKPRLLILSGVLQCIAEPFTVLMQHLSHGFDHIIIDRTAFIEDPWHRLTIQKVPSQIYDASYPAWFFNENLFISYLKEKYIIVADFDSYCDHPKILKDGKKVYWKGFYLKKKAVES